MAISYDRGKINAIAPEEKSLILAIAWHKKVFWLCGLLGGMLVLWVGWKVTIVSVCALFQTFKTHKHNMDAELFSVKSHLACYKLNCLVLNFHRTFQFFNSINQKSNWYSKMIYFYGTPCRLGLKRSRIKLRLISHSTYLHKQYFLSVIDTIWGRSPSTNNEIYSVPIILFLQSAMHFLKQITHTVY